ANLVECAITGEKIAAHLCIAVLYLSRYLQGIDPRSGHYRKQPPETGDQHNPSPEPVRLVGTIER
ncbi:MAG: hypothetical protein WBC04_22320, partial [Candidatus Acidiferrales bacterium]